MTLCFGGEFGMEEGARRSLLVASISESASRSLQLPPLRLPHFKLALPGALPRAGAASGKPALQQRSPRGPSPKQLAHAGAELVAVMGAGLIAAVSQAAQRMARARPCAHSSSPVPFHQSFKMPWRSHSNAATRCRESEALAKALMGRGREYERELDVRAAVQCFDEAAKLAPTDLLYLCMAAKQWSDLTFYHDVRTDRERQLVNLKAVEYATRAVEEHPNHAGGYLGTCISKGRLALFVDNRSKVRLAKEAQDAAHTALRLAPTNDLAHHLMGRWHYEMARVPAVVRAVVRIMYGTSLQPGTREEALQSYHRAVALAPERLVHRVEAARVHLELGQPEEARAQLAVALRCDVEDINAWHTRHDAEMLLARLDRRPWRQPSLVPPVPERLKGRPASLSTAALLGMDESAAVAEVLAASAPADQSK